ncbi:zinc-dependent alcohol dehydrogenase family protein [Streptomyces sp. NPDC048192]|jgi:NADPH:quinone reductase-like Zn-dependent oxidoreductase|uniref:zinc-dependent alcohol dehydrogenase family protein n=1 Tax=Streptomyces sp. NPDC048192 TaxID=3365510 RepID=UPI0037220818
MTTSARAVLFHETGGPEVLTVEQTELPDPGPDEVLVRVEAIGLNRAEAMLRAGTYWYQPALPGSRNGYEAAGEVVAVGADVTAFAPGDPVLSAANFNLSSHGVYGDLALLPETSVVPRPSGADAVTAAAVWLTYTTAYGALVERARLAAGQHVLITAAAGGAGTAAIQIARRSGAIPVAATRSEAKRQALLDAGAELVVVGDHEDVIKETMRLTGGRGADIVLDAIGGPVFRELGRAAADDACMVSYGWLSERPIELPRNWPVTVHGYSNLQMTGTPEGRHRAAHYLAAGLADGTLRPVIAEVYDGLDRIRDAHRLMESNRHTGKIVVRP